MRMFKVVLKFYDGKSLSGYNFIGMYKCAFDAIEEAGEKFRGLHPNFPFSFYSVTEFPCIFPDKSHTYKDVVIRTVE